MIRKILESYLIAKSFNVKMKMLDKTFNKKDLYKVKITKEQIGILEYCAFMNIKNMNDLKRRIK